MIRTIFVFTLFFTFQVDLNAQEPDAIAGLRSRSLEGIVILS